MKFFLGVLLLCSLVGSITNECVHICEDKCDVLAGICSSNRVATLLGIPCAAFGYACNATCDSAYCPCVDKIAESCVSAKNRCREDGVVGVFCEVEFDICVATQSHLCVFHVGAYLLSNLVNSVGGLVSVLPAIINATAIPGIVEYLNVPSIFEIIKLPIVTDLIKLIRVPTVELVE